jgi:hypothetical protein
MDAFVQRLFDYPLELHEVQLVQQPHNDCKRGTALLTRKQNRYVHYLNGYTDKLCVRCTGLYYQERVSDDAPFRVCLVGSHERKLCQTVPIMLRLLIMVCRW